VLANARIATQAERLEEMIGHGIEIVVKDLAEAIEMTGECLDGMLDVMITTVHQGETVTFSKDGWREVEDVGHQEVIGMNLRSKWAAGIGRRARVLRPRRRSPHLI